MVVDEIDEQTINYFATPEIQLNLSPQKSL